MCMSVCAFQQLAFSVTVSSRLLCISHFCLSDVKRAFYCEAFNVLNLLSYIAGVSALSVPRRQSLRESTVKP